MNTGIAGPEGGVFGIQNIRGFQRDPLKFLTQTSRQYEDIAYLRFGPQDIYLITHPDYVQEILEKQWDKLVKWERIAANFIKYSQSNIVILEGEKWQYTRQMASPTFHTERIQAYLQMITQQTQQVTQGWQTGSSQDIDQQMGDIMMGVIGEVFFGIPNLRQDNPVFGQALEQLMVFFTEGTRSLLKLPDWLPTARNRQTVAVQTAVKEQIFALIRDRHQHGLDRPDLLSTVMQLEDAQGRKFTDQQAYELVLAFFMAGRETPIRTLTWALYLLAKNPPIQNRLAQDLSQAETLTWGTLEGLTYLTQVVNETLRLYPPTWSLFFRRVIQPVQLGKYTLPIDSIAYVSSYVMHHSARWWENPETFNPDRFSAGWKERVHPYAYLPFGGGPRTCLGRHLAEMEIKVVLAALVKDFTFELAEAGQEVKPEARFTLFPQGGMRLKVNKR